MCDQGLNVGVDKGPIDCARSMLDNKNELSDRFKDDEDDAISQTGTRSGRTYGRDRATNMAGSKLGVDCDGFNSVL